MISKEGICLKVDPKRRIGVDDVINMLKGLRSEINIKIIRTNEKYFVENKSENLDDSNSSVESNTSASVTGNTAIPQIRELNEIASILRSMEVK